MKKFLWIAGLSLAIVATVISCKTRFETTKAQYKATHSDAAFERGKELTFAVCGGCHYDNHVHKFIGKQIQDVPGIAGKVYSANLTQSKSHGIAPQYSDAEIRYLLKTGIARDGRFLAYMLRPNMADNDINDIIVYLRSSDSAVSPGDTTVGLTHFTFIGKMYMNMHADPLAYKQDVKLPTDKVAMGYYLVDNLGCFHCHSKKVTKLNLLNPDQTKGYLAGGAELKGAMGKKVTASNITFDKNTGIGNYTAEQFRAALMEGKAPDRELQPPMPKFSMLKTEEVDAIYAYLQTVPPKVHATKGM